MSIFEHSHRARIYNPSQHPYKHTLEDFTYTHDAMPGVSTLQAALDWIFTVFYPRTQDPVDEVTDLPVVGNTIGDYRVVLDDGDGKAAGYQWQQREGDASAQWYKISDMDWGVSGILSQFLLKTQDVYAYRYGYDDVDEDGVALTGDLAGQRLYGGASAGTHLLLFANSGDGTGPSTGYVQFGDNARPLSDSAFSLGTTTYRWLKVWTDELTSGTLTLGSGSIVDGSGSISFGDENLATTGQITGTALLATGASTLTLDAGSITDSSGAISFGDEALSTSGSVAAGNLLLSAASITSGTGAISFDNEDLTTTGVITGGRLNVDNTRLDGNTLSSTNVGGDLELDTNGSGSIFLKKDTYGLADLYVGSSSANFVSITGRIFATGSGAAAHRIDNVTFMASTLGTTSGSLTLGSFAGGVISTGVFKPSTDGTLDLGEVASRWNSIYLDNSIGDGTNAITIANLLTFRDVGTPVDGDALFWLGGKWVASAPNTEIDHGTVTGLADDDHTQYALLLGRSGGQTLIGGTASGDDLTLTSTSHGTKGDIILASRLWMSVDNTWDFGDATHRVKDLYIAGQAIGLRAQNATTAGEPSASASNVGRLYFNTDEKDLMVDLGGTWKKVSVEKYTIQDAVTWDGSTSTKTYTVSADVSDARLCLWQFYSNSDTYEQVQVKITKSQTQVTITSQAPLPVGTYTLVGLG